VGVSNPIQSLPATLQDLYTNDPWRNIVNPKLVITLLGTSDLRFLWPLQERSGTTANDFSGNSRTGTYDGVTLGKVGPNQRVDGVGDLDGVNDLITAAAGCSVRGLGAFTFVLVAEMTAAAAARAIWFESTGDNAGSARFLIRFDADHKVVVAARSGLGAQAISTVTANSALSSGFYMIGASVDIPNDAISVWVNGASVAVTGTPDFGADTIVANTAPALGPRAGKLSNASEQWFDGSMAYIGQYSRLLDASEHLAIARAGGFA
jgi:hypothetical protein